MTSDSVTSSHNPRRQILVTCALPYANGDIHLGHLVESIQTDIWVRMHKAQGNDCTFVCADDAHGTAIMIRAEKEKITPEALIAKVQAAHEQDFKGFLIEFDNYHSTHSPENQALANEIFKKHKAKGAILEKTVSQLFDPEKKMFLADRQVKGNCPKCKSPDQYGDNCEVCGATYAAQELIDPKSIYTGTTPVKKENLQLFFDTPHYKDMLSNWLDSDSLQPEIANKLREWLNAGLKPWDISREAPYFGFEIPSYPGKYFYVWLDAPIGYMASFKNLCDKKGQGQDFDTYWRDKNKTELYHFIGKDIINFHGLFWPAMLVGAGFRKPTGIFAHGFLTLNNQKMSKSRGTFINARTYLNHLNPEYLRYYFASKLSASVEDIDLNLEDFANRVNADLVNKFANIASRCAKFIQKDFDAKLSEHVYEAENYKGLYDKTLKAGKQIFQDYEARAYAKAIRTIMQLVDQVNQMIDDEKPWVKIKDPTQKDNVQGICTLSLNLFRILMTYLAPILPQTATQVADFLKLENNWSLDALAQPLLGTRINPFKPLIKRIETKNIEAMLEDSKPKEPLKTKKQATKGKNKETIEIEDLNKIDLRIGKIVEAEQVEGADKLLKLQVDIGEENLRQIFAGIKSAYEAESLVGKNTLVVANLTPRKMRFGLSEGMVLAAGPGGTDIFLLSPDDPSKPGETPKIIPGMQVK